MYKDTEELLKKLKLEINPRAKLGSLSIAQTVSYTHLDVYKRQALGLETTGLLLALLVTQIVAFPSLLLIARLSKMPS